jgi:plasmid stabilization system protein ParE
MKYSVVMSDEADAQLRTIRRYIASSSNADIASHYTNGIAGFCQSLHTFPHRGSSRNDLRPGLRVIGYRKRVAILFEVDDGALTVTRSWASFTADRTTR